jgi:predicted DNA-binding protein
MATHLVNISAHVPQALAKRLEKVAKFEERSKSFYIKKALEEYLKARIEDIQDSIEIAKEYEEFKKSKQKSISFKEAFKGIK